MELIACIKIRLRLFVRVGWTPKIAYCTNLAENEKEPLEYLMGLQSLSIGIIPYNAHEVALALEERDWPQRVAKKAQLHACCRLGNHFVIFFCSSAAILGFSVAFPSYAFQAVCV